MILVVAILAILVRTGRVILGLSLTTKVLLVPWETLRILDCRNISNIVPKISRPLLTTFRNARRISRVDLG